MLPRQSIDPVNSANAQKKKKEGEQQLPSPAKCQLLSYLADSNADYLQIKSINK